jgi:hypothetical protein
MTDIAKRPMPVGLWIRLMARLWLVSMRLWIARLLIWLVKTFRLWRACTMTARAAFGPPFLSVGLILLCHKLFGG